MEEEFWGETTPLHTHPDAEEVFYGVTLPGHALGVTHAIRRMADARRQPAM